MSDKVCQNGNGAAPLTNGIANGIGGGADENEKIAGVFYNAKESSW